MTASAEIADIVETFDLLGDWDQRYRYLIELGECMPPMPVSDKRDENLVKECMSIVHLAAHPHPDYPDRVLFTGDCDTSIIKGVVALLVELFSGKTPDEIEALDVDALFGGLHLEEHLSPNRHVGVYAIVGKMKGQVRAMGLGSRSPSCDRVA